MRVDDSLVILVGRIMILFLNRSNQREPFLAKMDSWLKTKIQIDAGPGYRDSSTKHASVPTCSIY